MSMSNEARKRTLEEGVKVYAAAQGSRKTCYHTQPECSHYPTRPVKATDNVIDYYEMDECKHCLAVQDDD